MRATQLKRALLLRYILMKHIDHYSEVETYILMCIYFMNNNYERCSCNTLFIKLSKIHRTPYKKKLLLIVRNFKEKDLVRCLGKAAGTNLVLSQRGKLHLFELERKLRSVK